MPPADTRALRPLRRTHVRAATQTLTPAEAVADIPLLAHLLEVGLEEHPQSEELLVLHFVFLRFVFRDTHPSVWREKQSRLLASDLSLDLKYALYAGISTSPSAPIHTIRG